MDRLAPQSSARAKTRRDETEDISKLLRPAVRTTRDEKTRQASGVWGASGAMRRCKPGERDGGRRRTINETSGIPRDRTDIDDRRHEARRNLTAGLCAERVGAMVGVLVRRFWSRRAAVVGTDDCVGEGIDDARFRCDRRENAAEQGEGDQQKRERTTHERDPGTKRQCAATLRGLIDAPPTFRPSRDTRVTGDVMGFHVHDRPTPHQRSGPRITA